MTDPSRAALEQLIASWARAIETSRRQLAAEEDPAERERLEHGIRLLERRHDEFSAELSAPSGEDREGGEMLYASDEGITISNAALAALLAFAAKEDPAERIDCVALRVRGGEVTARAADHCSALTLTGPAEAGTPGGQWDVVLPFWKAAKKSLAATDRVRVEPHGATVQNATIMRQMEHGEDWEPAEAITFHYDAARAQREFPWEAIETIDRCRATRRLSSVQFDATLMARLALVQKAVGGLSCEIHLGAGPEDPIILECGGIATAVLMPFRDAPQKPRRGKKSEGVAPEQAVMGFLESLVRDPETTVSFAGPDGVEHEVKPRSRKAK